MSFCSVILYPQVYICIQLVLLAWLKAFEFGQLIDQNRTPQNESQADIVKAKEHLKMFSKEGLRTLCIGTTIIEESVFEEWRVKYQAVMQKKNASKSIEDDKKIEEEINKVIFYFNVFYNIHFFFFHL